MGVMKIKTEQMQIKKRVILTTNNKQLSKFY